MENTVSFRDFEERDIDFIYKCKNDDKLNSMIVGEYHHFTYEEAAKWVHGCMGEHDTFKFWAICTNDEEQRIVGWVSLSQIDYENRSACHHGIVIGDKYYREGTAMFEGMLLSMEYAFVQLQLHRLYGSCLAEHKISPHMLNALGFTLEGKQRDAVYRNERYYDILNYAMLSNGYTALKDKAAFDLDQLIVGFVTSIKESKKK
jgi:RimJ/RimL family protein N-acetyltransferase